MKKTLILCFCLTISVLASAQVYVDGVRLEPDNTGNYMEVDPMFRTDGTCAFRVDYGQAEPREDFLSDSFGKTLDFRSLVHGLNFLYSNGWELAEATVVGTNRRYLLKRR
ncbi:MAG TPA: hypothetical protein PK971_06505 [Saprospiraceae bacterium]|nr:hypothetical protein [Saprospiraceae bacterium]HND87956.1 hypothetical protein [Saprospiraceae bacterium]HNG90476.1 hypothetical protein [Saprospiraceae bacterium]